MINENNQSSEKLYTKLGYDWHKLELYEIAHKSLTQGDEEGIHLAKKSLELLLKDRDIGSSDPISMTLTNPQVIAMAIQNGLKVYNEAYEDQTIGDIINYNKDIFNECFGERKEEKEKDLRPFYNKKISDILKEMEDAEKMIGAKDIGHASKEEADFAKKNYNKYMKVYEAITLLERKRKLKLRTKVEDAYLNERFNDLFPLEKGGEGE